MKDKVKASRFHFILHPSYFILSTAGCFYLLAFGVALPLSCRANEKQAEEEGLD
jgi:hypothetical protein